MEQSKFYQIKNITEHEYTLVGCDGSVITRPIQDVDKSASAFTIQDAKAGDVILDGSNPFIFKKTKYQSKHCYAFCGINQDGNFAVNPYNWYGKEDSSEVWTWGSNLKPATKEQSDTFFAKMKEAGYWWDAEKKEVKKIEQKYTPKHKVGDTIYYNSFGEVKSMVVANVVTDSTDNPMYEDKEGNAVFEKDLIEQKPAWSEEDEIMFRKAIITIDNVRMDTDSQKYYQGICDWLKSLKDRVGCEANCTTTKEWSEEDEVAVKDICDKLNRLSMTYVGNESIVCQEDINWLKFLKDRVQPQNTWKPSEEQMLAINTAINVIGKGTINGKYLVELHEQLLKLREK